MKIILLQNIEKLGKKDEIKDVSPGYARNFLLPKKIVVLAIPTEIKKLQRKKIIEEGKRKKEEEKARFIAEKIKELELVFKEKVNPEGKLYGSINFEKIVAQLKEKNIIIREEQIEKFEPIKETGEYEVKIKLPPSLIISLRIKILSLDE